MKNYQKYLLTIFTALLFALCIPHKAEAKEIYKVTKMQAGTWTKLNSQSYNDETGDYIHYRYKISVPANSTIKISKKTTYGTVCVYKSKDDDSGHYFLELSNKSYNILLKKGTYYLESVDSYTLKVCYALTKLKDESNYSVTRAKKLASGKNNTFTFGYGHDFNKWYKIVLPKKKTISLYFKSLSDTSDSSDLSWELYDTKGNSIQTFSMPEGYSRTAALSKGTYWLKVSNSDLDFPFEPNPYKGYWSLYSLRWK